MSTSNWVGRDPSPRAVLSDGSSTPAGLRNMEVESGPLVLAVLLSDDVNDGGGGGDGVLYIAAGAGTGIEDGSCSVWNLISPESVAASRISSRALLPLRDLTRLVSFVFDEEPDRKLDIDVSRFEVVWCSAGTGRAEDDPRE
jgi:hypothetical protein